MRIVKNPDERKEEILDAVLDKYASYIAEQGQTELDELFHKKENHRMHNELFLRVSEKILPFFAKALEDAMQRGEILIDDPRASAYFFVYGQMGLLMSKDYSEEEKTQKIQQCLFEMLELE